MANERMLPKSALLLFLFALCCLVTAQARADDLNRKVADFFGVPEKRIWIECPQQSFKLEQEAGKPVLSMCLNKADNQKRCEITIHDLELSPLVNDISYDVSFADTQPWKRWLSVMQMHAFPDKGEQWRCPYAALEVEQGKFRMFNRWDTQEISRVSGNNCTEPGNSISGRKVFDDVKVKPGEWQSIKIHAKLSVAEDGEFQVTMDDKASPLLTGPNTYNDKRKSFVKFGIYNPAGFEEGHYQSCVRYRNVKIKTGGK